MDDGEQLLTDPTRPSVGDIELAARVRALLSGLGLPQASADSAGFTAHASPDGVLVHWCPAGEVVQQMIAAEEADPCHQAPSAWHQGRDALLRAITVMLEAAGFQVVAEERFDYALVVTDPRGCR